MENLKVLPTPIPGLLVIDLAVHGDSRGWFKENWQREKMIALGLPDFQPVQNNMSFNAELGVTRGIHAEPWDKFVSVAHGRVFGAWVDLRDGASFGQVFTIEIGPNRAVYVPRGVANSYQALESDTVYSYLVNEHWSPAARDSYTYVNLADPQLNIAWPIPLADAIISDADRHHPPLANVTPMPPRRTVIVGAGGQLGLALQQLLPDAVALTEEELDLTDPAAVAAYPWAGVGVIYNAAAYTAVDAAETPVGRARAWEINVTATARLVDVARQHRITFVHVSTDYVFDGTRDIHLETEPIAPLGVYGQTKAAADLLVATLPRYYVARTSWVVGAGHNFVKTMMSLADRGVKPAVVADQFGRLTFAADLAAGLIHLVESGATPGVYNLSNSGPVASWYDLARQVYQLVGGNPDDVTAVSTAEYGVGKALAPRPTHSTFDLSKIAATGFEPPDATTRLADYVAAQR